jgi:hypothetical protein
MTSLTDLLQRYSGATPENAPASVNQDFGQVAETVPSEHLASGLSQAFRSDQTPPFENMVANLFGASNGQQKAGILNQLLASVAPGALSGGILSEISRYLGAGQSNNSISPQQAEQVSPAAVQELAKSANQQDPSIVDRASSFYAQHPTLVQALGAGALAIIMSHMSNRS